MLLLFNKKQALKKIPTFNKRGNREVLFPQGFKLDDKRIFFRKIGWVSFRKSREIKGIAKNVTISRQGEHWFVSIQVEIEVPKPIHPSSSIISGYGRKTLFTLSNL